MSQPVRRSFQTLAVRCQQACENSLSSAMIFMIVGTMQIARCPRGATGQSAVAVAMEFGSETDTSLSMPGVGGGHVMICS